MNCNKSYCITDSSAFCYSTIPRANGPVAVGPPKSLWAPADPTLALGPTRTHKGALSLLRTLVTATHPERCIEALGFV